MTFDMLFKFFFFNDTATTEIYTLSLHDALPIYRHAVVGDRRGAELLVQHDVAALRAERSEEHTTELQSRQYLVCRILLEKKYNYNSCSYYLDENLAI